MANKFELVIKVFYKILLSLVFLFVISFLDHLLIQTLLVTPALVWFYYFSKYYQDNLLYIPYIQSQSLTLALSMLILGWAILLIRLGFKESLGVSFFCAVSAIITALWPIYFRTKKTIEKSRRFPYFLLFSFFTGLTLIFSVVSHYDSL